MPEPDLALMLEKVIRLNKADSTIKGVYFNPLFAEDLGEMFPLLEDGGFEIAVHEDETREGTLLSVDLRSPEGDIFDLGAVVLTGIDVIPEQLTRISDVIDFIEESLNA
jgi:hypothetical protein